LRTGLALSRKAGNDRTTARILHAFAELRFYEGDLYQALQYAEDGYTVAERAGDVDVCGWAMLDLALTRFALGELVEATAIVQNAIALFERAENTVGACLSRETYAQILLDGGNTESVEELFRAIRASTQCEVIFLEAVGWRLAGDLERAQRYFEQELPRIRAAEDPLYYSMVAYELGAILLIQGDPATAYLTLYKALPMLGRVPGRELAATFRHAMGLAAYGCGHMADTRTHLAASLRLYRTMSIGARMIDLGLAATLESRAVVAIADALQDQVPKALQPLIGWLGLAARLRDNHQPGIFPGCMIAALPNDLGLVIHSKDAARIALGDAAFEAAWAAARALTLDEAITAALALVEAIE
jgi:tetratricopeptide (TPR) repeat protein